MVDDVINSGSVLTNKVSAGLWTGCVNKRGSYTSYKEASTFLHISFVDIYMYISNLNTQFRK
jgi:hypothetical protein